MYDFILHTIEITKYHLWFFKFKLNQIKHNSISCYPWFYIGSCRTHLWEFSRWIQSYFPSFAAFLHKLMYQICNSHKFRPILLKSKFSNFTSNKMVGQSNLVGFFSWILLFMSEYRFSHIPSVFYFRGNSYHGLWNWKVWKPLLIAKRNCILVKCDEIDIFVGDFIYMETYNSRCSYIGIIYFDNNLFLMIFWWILYCHR